VNRAFPFTGKVLAFKKTVALRSSLIGSELFADFLVFLDTFVGRFDFRVVAGNT